MQLNDLQVGDSAYISGNIYDIPATRRGTMEVSRTKSRAFPYRVHRTTTKAVSVYVRENETGFVGGFLPTVEAAKDA